MYFMNYSLNNSPKSLMVNFVYIQNIEDMIRVRVRVRLYYYVVTRGIIQDCIIKLYILGDSIRDRVVFIHVPQTLGVGVGLKLELGVG